MTDAIPAKLRQADITRFLNRANQLRQYKPAITYWCKSKLKDMSSICS